MFYYTFQARSVYETLLANRIYLADYSLRREFRNDYDKDIIQLGGSTPIFLFKAGTEHEARHLLISGELFSIMRCEMSTTKETLQNLVLLELEYEDFMSFPVALSHNAHSAVVVASQLAMSNLHGVYTLNFSEHFYFPIVSVLQLGVLDHDVNLREYHSKLNDPD